MCGLSVAEKLDCHYQALDGEPFLEIQMCVLPNYRHLPRKNIGTLGVSSENEPSRIQRVNL